MLITLIFLRDNKNFDTGCAVRLAAHPAIFSNRGQSMRNVIVFCLFNFLISCSSCDDNFGSKGIDHIELKWIDSILPPNSNLAISSHTVPLIVNNKLYLTYSENLNQQHVLLCLNMENGDCVFIRYFSREINGSKIIAENGCLYFNANDSVFNINAETGALNWSVFVGSSNGYGNISSSNDYLYYGNAYFDNTNPEFFKIQKTNGQVIWKKTFVASTHTGFLNCGYDISTDLIYAGLFIEPDTVLGNQSAVICMNQDGQIVWRKDLVWQKIAIGGTTAFIIDNDKLLFGSATEFISLNKITGDSIWAFDSQGAAPEKAGAFDADPLLIESTIYASNTDGFVYAINSKNGQLRWKRSIFSTFDYQLSNDETALYTSNADLWGLDLKTGKVLIRELPPGRAVDSGNMFLSPVGVGKNRLFVVGTRAIYCYSSLGETND